MTARDQPDLVTLNCPRCGAPLKPDVSQVIECEYCHAKLLFRARGPENIPGERTVNGVRLAPYKVFDSVTQMEALHFMVPIGWIVRGGLFWVPQCAGYPARCALRAFNPNGLEAYEVFPPFLFGWSNHPVVRMSVPIGGNFYGVEFRPPMALEPAVREFVLAPYRNVPGLEIVRVAPRPDLPRRFPEFNVQPPPQIRLNYEGIQFRLRYQVNGQPVEENLFAVGEYLQMPAPPPMGGEQLYWSLKCVHSMQAAPDKLDALDSLYETMAFSAQANPAFGQRVQQITQQLSQQQIQSIHAATQRGLEMGRMYSEQHDALWNQYQQHAKAEDEIWNGYRQRDAMWDRVQDDRVHNMRNTEEYYDPYKGRNEELSSNYNQVWSSPTGEYILTDDLNFDPNTTGTGDWSLLHPNRGG
jgi:DNA-directed RNA polymerase subunit RPC12/RpoP